MLRKSHCTKNVLSQGERQIVERTLSVYNGDFQTISIVSNYFHFAALAWAAYGDKEAVLLAEKLRWKPFKQLWIDNSVVGDNVATGGQFR